MVKSWYACSAGLVAREVVNMSAFKRTNLKSFQKPVVEKSSEAKHWTELGPPVLIKEFGPVDYIDFSPTAPYNFAVTSSVHVQLYNPITKHVHKNISNFRETAYGASFRKDGVLLCVGGEESVVRVFEVVTKIPLRVFRGHTSAVHRCFFTRNQVHIASFSDDKTVRIWDLPTETEVTRFAEHTDYVRAGAVSPVSQDIILSAGYDNSVRMYDTRTQQSVLQVDHEAPVESVIFLPSGGIFLSAGGTEIRVWDAFSGGRLLARMNNHHKTITCMCLASGNKRLFSGSLDRHVKIYDVSTYNLVHTLEYPNSILSMGVSADDGDVVVGMVDGLVSVASREKDAETVKRKPKKSSYRFAAETEMLRSGDVVVREVGHGPISSHTEKCLRKFEYSKALDIALKNGSKPVVFIGVVVELMRRKGLQQALAGREDKSIIEILRFLVRNINVQQYTRILIDVANTFLDIYEDEKLSDRAMALARRLANVLREIEYFTEDLLSLQGAMRMLLAAESVADDSVRVPHSVDGTNHLVPSEQAREMLTINLT